MKILLSIWRLLDSRQRRRLVAMQMLSVLMALSTVGGMAAILPFFPVLADSHAIAAHPALRSLYEHAHFAGEHGFLIALGAAFAAAVVLSNAVNLFGSLAIDRFAFDVGDTLHRSSCSTRGSRSWRFWGSAPATPPFTQSREPDCGATAKSRAATMQSARGSSVKASGGSRSCW